MKYKYDVCIIGAGSGGLTAAAFLSTMGAKVALIEKHKMGGDCLNTGCVPSKALLAAAKKGLNFSEAMNHVHATIRHIEPHDSIERFEGLGVKVIQAEAKFISPHAINVNNQTINAKRFIIASGSSAIIPNIEGLKEAKPLTNETLFDLKELPKHLVIIGAGPIGAEMAKCFQTLGSKVTLITHSSLLPRDDAEAVEILRQALIKKGVTLLEKTTVKNVNTSHVMIEGLAPIPYSHILVAAGRAPNLDLGLEKAGVNFTPKGITVNPALKTNQSHIYAIGDCNGEALFTHAAGFQGSLVSQNILFKRPINFTKTPIGWATYTSPEIAHIGLLSGTTIEKDAKDLKILTAYFKDNDRAVADTKTNGFVKLIVTKKGIIKGATIVGENAGDMLALFSVMLNKNMKISDLTSAVFPYPTLAETIKRAASLYYKEQANNSFVRNLVKFLLKF